MIGIGGASRLRPSHTTVRTGPYTAVREVRLTRLDLCWLGVRVHSPPSAIRCLPVPPAGLHPSAPMRSPVSTGCSAACRSRDSCPTCLSSRSGLQPPVPGSAYLLTPPFGTECLISLADGMTYYALC